MVMSYHLGPGAAPARHAPTCDEEESAEIEQPPGLSRAAAG
jgi:hypothetical protein